MVIINPTLKHWLLYQTRWQIIIKVPWSMVALNLHTRVQIQWLQIAHYLPLWISQSIILSDPLFASMLRQVATRVWFHQHFRHILSLRHWTFQAYQSCIHPDLIDLRFSQSVAPAQVLQRIPYQSFPTSQTSSRRTTSNFKASHNNHFSIANSLMTHSWWCGTC